MKASREYRASDKGRERRRQQNRHYRQRRREREAAAAEKEPAVQKEPAAEEEAREGKRKDVSTENFVERMCDRPGCYVLFWVKHEESRQRFCSVMCCLALRRVLDREKRYQSRRERRRNRRRARRVRSPDTS